MAVLAGGRSGLCGPQGPSVDAAFEARALRRVTTGTIHRTYRQFVVRVLQRHAAVTTDTGVGAMNGPGQPRLVYEQ